MTARRVLLAPTVRTGEAIKRADGLTDALVVTPRSLDRVRGLNVSDVLVADGMENVAGFEEAMRALEICRAKQRREWP